MCSADEAYRNDTCLPPFVAYMLPLLVVAASLLPVTRTPLPNKPPTSEHAHNKQLGLLDSLSTALDKHALDPLDPSPSRVPGLDYFKRLAREDYASAEVIWAGLYCSLLVSFAMQLTRAVVLAQVLPPRLLLDEAVCSLCLMLPPEVSSTIPLLLSSL